jgi:hypothetical protein
MRGDFAAIIAQFVKNGLHFGFLCTIIDANVDKNTMYTFESNTLVFSSRAVLSTLAAARTDNVISKTCLNFTCVAKLRRKLMS